MVKRCVSDLALFGGPPAFAEAVFVGSPHIGRREDLLRRISEVLDRRWLTNDGAMVRELERRVAERLGVKFCIAVCNATTGLQIAARALGLTGEVIAPSLTFIATAHALSWIGLQPVFCDVDPHTGTLDPARIEECITPRTTAVLGVHIWGRACDVDGLTRVVRRNNLALFFDAAHAFGCSYRGRSVGNFGAAEVLSFHATKVLNTFEGGAIATNDEQIAVRAAAMRNFGLTSPDDSSCAGTNGKMNEASAAMGLTGLAELDAFIGSNRSNHRLYSEMLADLPGLTLFGVDETEECNYHHVVCLLDSVRSGVTRDLLADVLLAENVAARKYFHPGCHLMEPYGSADPGARSRLKHTENILETTLALPNGGGICAEHVAKICQIIRLVVQNGDEVMRRAGLRMSSARLDPARGRE